MSFEKKAYQEWSQFLEKKITDYSYKRNYDYGPNESSSVSKLSPYISHRILLEYEIIKDTLRKYKGKNVNKFIEEVYWRIYWKGFLENRPCIWDDFISNKNYEFDLSLYEDALDGSTHLPYFNSWIEELKNFNYLHNHTRMWFASTWIFNLCLPWELGAKLFFEYLYDGDAASNLLSWRWVAGLHTKGKKYFFTTQNLKKFSNNRYCVDKIINHDINVRDNFEMLLSSDIYDCKFKKSSNYLLMFENDLHQETLGELIKRYKKVFLILLDNSDRRIKIKKSVYDFKKVVTSQFAEKFDNIQLSDSTSLPVILEKIPEIDLLYPSIGENNDFINRYSLLNKKKINKLVREEDLFSWKFARKGFFKFKENISSINKFIDRPKRLW
tara:strand:+ start:6969 stop:8117 length:1149 start_codon:yes stop_codon:yes gene_type:complete